VKFFLFWCAVVVQLPILAILPSGRISIAYSRFFWIVLMWVSGVHYKKTGVKLSKNRPLMIVSNHISVLEFAVFPIVFGAGMIGKDGIKKMPLVGYVAKKVGVVFIKRERSAAATETAKIADSIMNVKYPMLIFPEGTTTSGTYVLPLKSAMFSFAEGNDKLTIQPVVMHYRTARGHKISDQVMADDYAYFDNVKMTQPPYCKVERSAFGQLFHIMKIGGVRLDLHVLPPADTAGLNRKQIAELLHAQINEYFNKHK
jgi:1-acyl-sn-glycerol-3-phosphate acyltransferase